ncbi:hypothetical protein EDB83DRAFT_517592 [Lactarius deliciosus]|nr:hypothetical protein EDB83DRAFT_517592 [Lactarius deliciosus]
MAIVNSASVNSSNLALLSSPPYQHPESSSLSPSSSTTSNQVPSCAPTSNEGAAPRKRPRSDMTADERKEAHPHTATELRPRPTSASLELNRAPQYTQKLEIPCETIIRTLHGRALHHRRCRPLFPISVTITLNDGLPCHGGLCLLHGQPTTSLTGARVSAAHTRASYFLSDSSCSPAGSPSAPPSCTLSTTHFTTLSRAWTASCTTSTSHSVLPVCICCTSRASATRCVPLLSCGGSFALRFHVWNTQPRAAHEARVK